MTLKAPELPKPERMPRPRRRQGRSVGGRITAAVAGLVLGSSSLIALARAVGDPSGRSSPFLALALLVPTAVLLRYALTGEIRLS